jgi:hypothetical protein
MDNSLTNYGNIDKMEKGLLYENNYYNLQDNKENHCFVNIYDNGNYYYKINNNEEKFYDKIIKIFKLFYE